MTSLKKYPERIVCLTEETVETLYLLHEDSRIVGISGFAIRPKIARKTKPKVSTYLDANFDEIIELKPDIVLTWSDLQADISAELIRRGIEVYCFNHRNINGIFSMIIRLGQLVGKEPEAERLCEQYLDNIKEAKIFSETLSKRPRIYFEEWYDPLISGICWVSEILEICGGDDIYSENKIYPDAKRRIIANPNDIIVKNPDILIASWCGKAFKPDKVRLRSGWEQINALKNNMMHEIHSSIILQPGPAALTEGIQAVKNIIQQWNNRQNN